MSTHNFFEVDQAAYITLEAALKTLDPEVIRQIHSVKSITSTIDTSVGSKKINFNKTGNKGIFMGLWSSQLYYNNTKSYKLAIDEISENGVVGSKFFLTLHSNFAEEWQNNRTVQSITKGVGKGLIVFQYIPYQIKSQNIEFHLMNPSPSCPWMKVMNYFSSIAEAKSEQYVYTTLFDAEKFMATNNKQKMKCHLYAVVHSVIYKPKEGRLGKGQGMYVIVDPSCYEEMVKQREYCMHVFTSSLAAFPKIEIGDIVRLHRAWAEIRPRDGLPDFRVFREDDLVIFPWNDEERPRCSASRFTFTKDDVEHVNYLKKWSLERYKQRTVGQQTNNVGATDKNPITISDIKPNENFNLPCRVVAFFDEDQGVAIWVEDGTRCALTTVSDAYIEPYNSQQTQVVDQSCYRICIRCPKLLLSTIHLEPQMLLYLREVVPTVQTASDVDVVQFEIKGAIDLLPLNTRYHKSLMQRLGNAKIRAEEVQTSTVMVENNFMEFQQQPADNRPNGKKSVDSQSEKSISHRPAIEIPHEINVNPNLQPIQPVAGPNAKNSTSSQKENIASSGEGSIDRAMKDIPSDFFEPFTPPRQQLVCEDFEREQDRLSLLIEPTPKRLENLEVSQVISRPSVKSQNLASLEDLNFSQVVASTQKPPRYEIDRDESHDADQSSISHDIPNGQQILSPAESQVSVGANNSSSKSPSESPASPKHGCRSRSPSRSISPHPAFRAVDEVLEIQTNCRSKTDDSSQMENENQLNTSIDAPLFRTRPGKGDQIIVTSKARAKQNKQVVERVTFGHGQQEEIVLIANQSERVQTSAVQKRNASKMMTDYPPGKSRRASGESSSSDSIVEIVQEDFCEDTSQESDKESIVILDPLSQLDLEKIFCAVEEAHLAKKCLQNLEEERIVQPGDRFRITARICALLPKPHLPISDDPAGLKSLIVAFCLECRHLWQYNQFIDSVSQQVRHPRAQPSVSPVENDEIESVVINYFCSREDHTRNIRMLIEGSSNIDDYEFDENLFLDRSYNYICPLCNSKGISHSLCTLKPSFFFRIHATQLIEKTNSQHSTCLHILASGVHAEYFLGTKADHVLRNQEIWKRAEQRISKLLQCEQPVILGLLRCPSNPKEICLEFTKNVFAVNHLLPW